MDGQWWLALNSHEPYADSQLELPGDWTTPDSPDPLRVSVNPSSYSGFLNGNQKYSLKAGKSSADGSSIKWVVSFVYAPLNRRYTCEFWDLLRAQASNNRYPWLCVGDFNQVGSMWEKQGGVECSRHHIEGFQNWVFDYALMDLEFNGPLFTWSNNQVGLANVRERLDKAFATTEWRDLFPYA
ncbi:uncharacterized protein LOC114299052 [Camellia sinensis]|uniref:uncharacterized protein LOC114299052 n=1 Tax=Camellia sinensis TaxID=4442 RepID=UPI001035BBD0|nr:uncharacterized protein LOC114299052 [Camellia sinensis]